MKAEIAKRIRMLRLEKNLNQENVALELGITTGAYSNIERGVTDLTITRLEQIATIMGTNLVAIITGVEEEPILKSGYATKEDMDRLEKQLAALRNEVENLRDNRS